jgi:divinyl protochlorophyllide a 8-vinyl-reductase
VSQVQRAGPTHRDRPAARGLVGPNAVLQLAAALRDRHGEEVARAVFARAGCPALLREPPTAMVDEHAAADCFAATGALLAPHEAAGILAEAGRRTADYLLAHRIPRPAQWALRLLPKPCASRLLLAAIGRNAWTFAGSGGFRAWAGAPCVIEIEANPLAAPGCPWHVAVFGGLFRALVAREVVVGHRACCQEGAPACRFEISLRSA